jgi:hypothetical protein
MLIGAVSLGCGDGSAAPSAQSAAQPTKTAATSKAAGIDSLLAPIALYPDQLLAQMLLCAGEPAKVVALHTWLGSNSALKGTELQDAATLEGFDPSFVGMTLFPDVVKFMAEQVEWTTSLGKAFAADRPAVFASIQSLRKNAYEKGALKTTPQQEVATKTTPAGEQVIVIEPANPQVVYVPQYTPELVYTDPPVTTVVIEEDSDDDEWIAAGLIGFTAGVAIGAAFDNDYYYAPYGWHGGFHMYNDAWDDWYDHREDRREAYVDHRENLVEERGERAGQAREQRTERAGERQESRTQRAEGRQDTRAGSQTQRTQQQRAQRTERQQTRQESRPQAQAQRDQRRAEAQARTSQPRASSYEARGHSGTQRVSPERSGTRSDAFSGYSSGRSARAASARGHSSRGARGGGRRR